MDRDAIIALGNPLMGDEGIGVFILERLRRDSRLPLSVDLIDTAGSILTALHSLSHHHKVVFLDCALMGEVPGTIRRFLPGQVKSEKTLPRLSLHEGDLLEMLETAKNLGESAEEVVIYGIEPEFMSPKIGLSETLAKNLQGYIDGILGEFSTTPV